LSGLWNSSRPTSFSPKAWARHIPTASVSVSIVSGEYREEREEREGRDEREHRAYSADRDSLPPEEFDFACFVAHALEHSISGLQTSPQSLSAPFEYTPNTYLLLLPRILRSASFNQRTQEWRRAMMMACSGPRMQAELQLDPFRSHALDPDLLNELLSFIGLDRASPAFATETLASKPFTATSLGPVVMRTTEGEAASPLGSAAPEETSCRPSR